MSYSPNLSSAFNDTRMRSGQTSFSGMCSLCSEHCVGTCEIGLSAMRGEIAVYPTNSGDNQVASEKIMPVDYSHFNINGRVFGAVGIEADADQATIFNVKLERTIGRLHPVRVAMPVVLPAVIKLDWKDYFAGAAMAGVICVIGENALGKFKDVEYRDAKVVRFESLKKFLTASAVMTGGMDRLCCSATGRIMPADCRSTRSGRRRRTRSSLNSASPRRERSLRCGSGRWRKR